MPVPAPQQQFVYIFAPVPQHLAVFWTVFFDTKPASEANLRSAVQQRSSDSFKSHGSLPFLYFWVLCNNIVSVRRLRREQEQSEVAGRVHFQGYFIVKNC